MKNYFLIVSFAKIRIFFEKTKNPINFWFFVHLIVSLQTILKKVRKISNIALWAVIGLLIAMVVLLRVPTVQQFIGSKTADALSEKLGTEVSVGRVDLGFLNRITIDDVNIRDQQGEQLLKASRLSAKIDYLALLKRKTASGAIR